MGADSTSQATHRPIFRRTKFLVIAAASVLIIVAVGLGVGLGVGLTRGNGDGGDDGGNDDGTTDGDGEETSTPRSATTKKWAPQIGDTWQIVLKNPIDLGSGDDIDPDVAIYDLDLYDNDAQTFQTLQDAGKKVICYFSAGSWENWRDDKDDFDDADLGKPLDGWPGERWLNVSSPSVRSIMKTRIRVASQKGCDAIDPDNVDGYQNDNGLDLTSDDAISFVQFLSDEANSHNMSVGLKNAGDIIPDVVDLIDFSVNEQCIEYSECDTFAKFIEADKPVFNIEYPPGAPNDIPDETRDEICSHQGNATDTEGFSKVIKKMNLDGWVEYCDGETYTTKTQS